MCRGRVIGVCRGRKEDVVHYPSDGEGASWRSGKEEWYAEGVSERHAGEREVSEKRKQGRDHALRR